MDRRTFLLNVGVLATWVGVSVVISGCSSDDDPVGPSTNTGNIRGVVGTNHGHNVTLTKVQVDAGNAVTLTLTTGNGHTHSVSLTEIQVTSIGAGNQVSATSSSDSGHSHLATFN
jgi:hypothetical protein